MYFRYNTQLGPPYRVILDTNFINFSIQNKLDIMQVGADAGHSDPLMPLPTAIF